MGGSAGKSKSKSSGSTSSSENVWGTQGDALEKLYGSAEDLFGSQIGQQELFNQLAGGMQPSFQQATQGAQGGMENLLGGGAYGDTTDVRNALMDSMARTSGGSNMGKMYESIVGGQGNEYIDPMVDSMKRSQMENLQGMQASAGLDAAAAGQGGSSRHAMQNAMLANQTNESMQDRETLMRGGAYDKDLAMKMDIARQADTGIQNTQQRYMDMLGGANQNIGAGINAGQNVQNLGMGAMAPYTAAMEAPWKSMLNYGNVIGRPTVLGKSSGNQSGSSKGKSAGASLAG